MEIKKLLLSHYLPYAKANIISRAIPGIDGLKPVQRRIVYSMHNLGLGNPNANRTKSVKIVGDVMGKYHPHGDSSIYEALVLMSKDYDKLNVPYIDSKGSFGKVYSSELQYAAMRYTEAKLSPITAELFDGIKENAVDFVDNFDATDKEPALLPVKFPTVLINSNAGVAVGTSSNIPSFNLKNVCLATKGIIDGTITTPLELSKVLGVPEFTTGGFLHASESGLEKLSATGKGSFTISGRVQVYTNQIIIEEIPFNTTAEAIVEAIVENMKEGKLKGVREVKDEIGLGGLRLVVDIKGGYNSREVLQELCLVTPLRSQISFRTRLIVGNRCKELSLLQVLEHWIDFRQNCIQRVYQYRLDKNLNREHLLSTWEKISGDLLKVIDMISKNTDDRAKELLKSNYGLDEEQAEYLLEMKIRNITQNRANKLLTELAEVRENIKNYKVIVADEKVRKDIIYKELQEIIDKYGNENKTLAAPELDVNATKVPEVKISEDLVTVVMLEGGYIRRIMNNFVTGEYQAASGEKEIARWVIKNNEHLLVFDRFGTVHKLLVDDIDSGRGKLTDKLHEKAGLEKPEDVIWADACGDYSKYFNLIYPNGRGTRVYYVDARPNGNRNSYKIGYSDVEPGRYFITTENQFFLITRRNKASYCDITELGVVSNRSAFKVARLSSGDCFVRLQPYKDVPNIGLINLDKYNKDYTVGIGSDVLWVDEEFLARARKEREEYMKRYENGEEAPENTSDEVLEDATMQEN